ncbi:DUF6557 family protein [Lactobacillus gasseri]|uniref:DUF6557 family protein n=1 Tax=Lactobacillus gasseri TaxID=1596 RepID=UPI0022E6308C|nr:DUF6557 family protein [Lactobacillus gasseri]
MRTVQEVLKNIDEDKLIENYFNEHPLMVNKFDDDMTIGQIKSGSKKLMKEYIDRLRSLNTTTNKDQMIYYVYEYLHDTSLEQYIAVSPLAELREKGAQSSSYGIEYTKQEEILGYYVANTDLTQYYLLDVMVEILWDASFFGINQEDLEDAKQELEEAAKGPYKKFTYEEFEEYIDSLGPRPPKLSRKDKIRKENTISKVNKIMSEFDDHLKQQEIEKVLRSIDQ